ncbi:MAG: hypothetical protein WAM82_18970 [Thermoanaerobaculia bacterium]
MRELDPFDASVLHVLARVSENQQLRGKLVNRLSTAEGKEIARAILAEDPEQLDVSEDAKVTAASLRRAVAR